ncbi:S9 family peptidase [Amycolatopsis nalaikhensis]|uniref:S9 family peptidase n=1 Tax=Amycolatopsis nalaikhensis TaxID=715472 RepID=A0ABY8XEK7_9PSEU|nr:S9 family peptidase [Amycolatopsis sp. 2-2]WIV54052.1 S9 family peptidase [Amycolatopsis sp. 2-2]
MSDLVFMSHEHVARMNELLAASDEVLAACAALDRDYEIAYELSGGPDGTAHWVLRFDRRSGARFSLEPPRDADLTYFGDWTEVIRGSRAARSGEPVEANLTTAGDVSVTERVADAYATAQRVATIPTEFPDVLTVAQRKVTEHLRAVHEPAFGLPHSMREPQVTRDGSRTAVTGAVFDELVGLPRTAVYTAEDGELRPVTSGKGSSRGARFSPDGRTLAFLSDRRQAGVFQLHLLDGDHFGEARPAPEVPGTVEYVHWSPDGDKLLLGVAGLGAELSGGQGSGRNSQQARERPSWFPEVDDGTDDAGWRSLWVLTVSTGELTQVSPAGLNCWEAGWCGADRVVAIASVAPGEDDWYTAHLSLIDLDGHARQLLGSDVQLGLPTGSPDGKWVTVVEAVCSDRWLVAGDVLLVETATGAVRRLDTRGADVTHLQWIDAERLGYVGLRRLDSVAGVIGIPGGAVEEVLSTDFSCSAGGFLPQGSFTADGRVLTVRDSYEQAPLLVLSGSAPLASVAHPGTEFVRTVAGKAEVVTWTAPDGLEIDGILCRPAGNGPFPLVVSIHGGPVWAYQNSWSMRYPWVPLLVEQGYAVLSPNPRGSCGRGQEFAGRVVGDMGGADTHDFLSGIDALVERGLVDGSKVGLIGGSYGGFMSSWLVTQDTRFAAAVPVSPVTNWYSQSFTSNIAAWGNRILGADPELPGTLAHTRSPVLHASKARTPCLNVAGALDNCTPPGQAREFHQALRAHGVPSALVIYPEEGHGVRAFPAQIDFLARVLQWFERYMPAS